RRQGTRAQDHPLGGAARRPCLRGFCVKDKGCAFLLPADTCDRWIAAWVVPRQRTYPAQRRLWSTAPGQRSLSPVRFCPVLGPRADFVPGIADGVFEALPAAGVTRFPVAAGISFQSDPVTTSVALVRTQLVAIAVGGLILR